jgi:hypothetical protein
VLSSTSASQASEIVDLLLMLLIVPVTVHAIRGMRFPGRSWMTAGFFTIAFVRLFSVVERYFLGNPNFPTKQFINAAAGIAFAIGIWQLALAMRRGELL